MQFRELIRTLITILMLAVLAGCSSLGSRPIPAPPDTATKPAPAPSTGKRGGYYLDDGPGDNPPANIDGIADAVPRPETPLERANRPYMALGEKYTPMTEYQPYRAQGVASWYGRRYHGNKTSSGEVYDMYGMTAAHPTLPIPSYVRVTNPENGRSVVVRVNDRGPFKKDRLIDLSYAAAYKLRLNGKGSGQVQVEAIDVNNMPSSSSALPPQPAPQATMERAPVPAGQAAGLFVQVGAFRLKENADELRDRVRQQQLAQNVAVENWYNKNLYRVRLGPFDNRADAESAAETLRRAFGISTYVITQQETP